MIIDAIMANAMGGGSGGSSGNASGGAAYPDTLIFEGGTLKGNAEGVAGDGLNQAAVKISDYCPPEHELGGAYFRVWWMADDGEGAIDTREYRGLCSVKPGPVGNTKMVNLAGDLAQAMLFLVAPEGITDEAFTQQMGLDMSASGVYLIAMFPIAGVLTVAMYSRIELILNKPATPYLLEKPIDKVDGQG
jgi:hypothetical protein